MQLRGKHNEAIVFTDNEIELKCPLGGDPENNCIDCIYSGDYLS